MSSLSVLLILLQIMLFGNTKNTCEWFYCIIGMPFPKESKWYMAIVQKSQNHIRVAVYNLSRVDFCHKWPKKSYFALNDPRKWYWNLIRKFHKYSTRAISKHHMRPSAKKIGALNRMVWDEGNWKWRYHLNENDFFRWDFFFLQFHNTLLQ